MAARVCSDDSGFLLSSVCCCPERGLDGRGNLEKLSGLHPLDWARCLMISKSAALPGVA